MRIWLLKTGEEMPDDGTGSRLVRMAILAEELVSRGHEVVFWNACFNHHTKIMRYDETTEVRSEAGYKIVFLKGRAYAKNISANRFLHQREVAQEFAKQAPTYPSPDVILSALPTIELSEAAASYAKTHDVSFAVDCRDMWPEVITEQMKGAMRFPAWLVAQYYERQRYAALSQATSIIGVTDVFLEWAQRAARRTAGDKDRVFHLAINPNTNFAPEVLTQTNAFWDSQIGPATPDETLVCFAGTLSKRLDLVTLLEACRKLGTGTEVQNLKIVLCGKGDLLAEFEACARDVPQVTFAGWRNAADLHVLMQRAHVGLLPYPPAFDFSNHYVNKIGEYLEQGLPTLTGLDGLTHNLLSPHGLKIPYIVGDSDSLAATLRGLPSRKVALAAKADVARQLYLKHFDPRKVYVDFADHLESLAEGTS